MPRRAANTIVLITRQDLVRADFSAGSAPSLLSFWTQPRPDLPDVAALVEAGLLLGPKPGKQVWVLDSDVWMQTLPVPATRTAGLPDGELASALNFEAEAFSGQNALESTAAFIPQPSSGAEKTYLLVQVRTSDLDMIDETVRKSGSRLGGIGHPAGMPRPLGESKKAPASWLRAELWPDNVVLLHQAAKGPVEVHVLNSAPQLGQWQVEWDKRRTAAGQAIREELLLEVGVAPPACRDFAVVARLEDDAALRLWLTGWAGVLAGQTEGGLLRSKKARSASSVPLVRPPRRPLTVKQRRMISAALAVAACLLCAGHYYLMNHVTQDAEERFRIAKEPAQKLAGLQKQVKDLEAKVVKDKALSEKLVAQIGHLESQRLRLSRLMAVLSETRPEHLMVEKIDNQGGEPKLYGVCWEPHLADLFATRLGQVLPEYGLKVEAPKKKSQEVVPGGGPCSFEIQFRYFGGLTPEPRLTAGKGGIKTTP